MVLKVSQSVTEFFEKDSFLLVYKGETISAEEADKRDVTYAADKQKCFLFNFIHYAGYKKQDL